MFTGMIQTSIKNQQNDEGLDNSFLPILKTICMRPVKVVLEIIK